MQLDGVSALVAGGASGLGLATVERLVGAGAKVTIADLPGSDGAAQADRLGDAVGFAPTDVTDADAVAAAVSQASEAGPLRVAVCTAGVGSAERTVGKQGQPADLGAFEQVVRINLIGTFNVLRLAAAEIATNEPVGEERGVIVNTASIAAFDGQIGQTAYAASKGGVASMTLPAARDLARQQIRVVTIAPGLFATPLLAGLPEQARQSLEAQTPHPARLGEPEEYARLVAAIVDNPMLNGETIRLDGAIRMGPR